ncbi:MAG: endonuclease III [Peptococcaceae bacterium]|nr:endonuclease III [Peptococcaceae bacterium]
MVDSLGLGQIIGLLRELYPHAKCELNFSSPFELLLATILSAQCTDARVNQVTPALFAKYAHPCELMQVAPVDLEADIRSCGLYRNKAKNIVNCCRELCLRHNGQVPETVEDLRSLPGVGRKTANVVANTAFNVPALGVDTHVFRVARRLGLTSAKTAEKVELELCALLSIEDWGPMHHLLIWHGRRICHARHPQCHLCPLRNLCPHHKGEDVR